MNRLTAIANDCIYVFLACLILGVLSAGAGLIICVPLLYVAFGAGMMAALLGIANMIISIWRRK